MFPKEETNATPFRLTFGHNAMFPPEIYLQSTRIQRKIEIPSENFWDMMLDALVYLDEERLDALNMLIRQKERVVKTYKKKVKPKAFLVNDLV